MRPMHFSFVFAQRVYGSSEFNAIPRLAKTRTAPVLAQVVARSLGAMANYTMCSPSQPYRAATYLHAPAWTGARPRYAVPQTTSVDTFFANEAPPVTQMSARSASSIVPEPVARASPRPAVSSASASSANASPRPVVIVTEPIAPPAPAASAPSTSGQIQQETEPIVAEREAVQARCTQLRAQLAEGQDTLLRLLQKVQEAERLKRDFGTPLLLGAVTATEARVAQLRQENDTYRKIAAMESQLAEQTSQAGATTASLAPRSRAEAEAEAGRLDEAETMRSTLRQQLSKLLNEEQELLAAAATESELLGLEREDLKVRLEENHKEAAVLRQRAGSLEEERNESRRRFASAQEREQRMYDALFGDITHSSPPS